MRIAKWALPIMMLPLTVALVTPAHAISDITYTVNEAVGPGLVTGSITTDGNTGVLGSGDIVDWNLTLNDGTNPTFVLQGPLSGSNSQELVYGSDLTASASQLMFDFSDSNLGVFALENSVIGDAGPFICYSDAGCSSFPSPGISLAAQNGESDTVGTALSEPYVIGSVDSSPTPEPSSLLLFGTGLVGLAGALRRRYASQRV